MMQVVTIFISLKKLVWKKFHIYGGVRTECFLLRSYVSSNSSKLPKFLPPSSHITFSFYLISNFSKLLIMIVDKVQFSGYPAILMDEPDGGDHC